MRSRLRRPQKSRDSCTNVPSSAELASEPSMAGPRVSSCVGVNHGGGMRGLKTVLLSSLTFLGLIVTANATVRIHIDLSAQQMNVESFCGRYTWPVSTARSGYYTPRGSYAPTGMQRMHYSRKFHMSPMPYSIFFRGGYAIHGSYETRSLGRPASHGCVRLDPANAALLYQMVEAEGATISITGTPPVTKRYAARRRYASWRRVNRYRYWTGGFFPFAFWR